MNKNITYNQTNEQKIKIDRFKQIQAVDDTGLCHYIIQQQNTLPKLKYNKVDYNNLKQQPSNKTKFDTPASNQYNIQSNNLNKYVLTKQLKMNYKSYYNQLESNALIQQQSIQKTKYSDVRKNVPRQKQVDQATLFAIPFTPQSAQPQQSPYDNKQVQSKLKSASKVHIKQKSRIPKIPDHIAFKQNNIEEIQPNHRPTRIPCIDSYDSQDAQIQNEQSQIQTITHYDNTLIRNNDDNKQDIISQSQCNQVETIQKDTNSQSDNCDNNNEQNNTSINNMANKKQFGIVDRIKVWNKNRIVQK